MAARCLLTPTDRQRSRPARTGLRRPRCNRCIVLRHRIVIEDTKPEVAHALQQRLGELVRVSLLQVCASLDDAHHNGLIHRDIKPANIIVSKVSAAWDFVKVLDFGLVKLESPRQSEDRPRLTHDDQVSGTPGFIAPEVVLGTEADHRVDIYALGCVAYWLVTGELVFEGPQVIKVMYDHVHTPPAPPSSRSVLPIPPELETLILACLEKEPSRRPASASELQERLQAVPLAAPWTRERAERWWAEHAPRMSSTRPVADVLLSQEAHPPRVIRRARPR
jgi:eukaryotic-like serine/threonine-protein kinase